MNKIAKKFTPKTFTQDQTNALMKAAALGAVAWHEAINAPAQDYRMMVLIGKCSPDMTIAILDAWQTAWHEENLHAK